MNIIIAGTWLSFCYLWNLKWKTQNARTLNRPYRRWHWFFCPIYFYIDQILFLFSSSFLSVFFFCLLVLKNCSIQSITFVMIIVFICIIINEYSLFFSLQNPKLLLLIEFWSLKRIWHKADILYCQLATPTNRIKEILGKSKNLPIVEKNNCYCSRKKSVQNLV